MIGKIKGKLVEIEENLALIETSCGIFYQVYLSPNFIKKHPLKSLVEVYTFLEVKEDGLNLYGFESKKEYQFFLSLISVSGVGTKMAFSVISFLNVEEAVKAVKENNLEVLAQVPRLGKKTATKIILELSQKLKKDIDFSSLYLSDEDKTVIDTLVTLGYQPTLAKKIFAKIPKNLSLEEKIKWALKNKI